MIQRKKDGHVPSFFLCINLYLVVIQILQVTSANALLPRKEEAYHPLPILLIVAVALQYDLQQVLQPNLLLWPAFFIHSPPPSVSKTTFELYPLTVITLSLLSSIPYIIFKLEFPHTTTLSFFTLIIAAINRRHSPIPSRSP